MLGLIVDGLRFECSCVRLKYLKMANLVTRLHKRRDEKTGAKVGVVLVVFLTIFLTILPVHAGVYNVNISPLVLVEGKPITFYGGDTGSSVDNQIGVYVFVGLDCQSDNLFASTFTIANSTNTYSVTLSFPVDPEYSGWKVEQTYQQFQTALPPGSYSVGVADAASISSGSGGICRNFVITSQPVPEFSLVPLTLILTLAVSVYLLHSKKQNSAIE